MTRFLCAFFFALAAFYLARGIGISAWRWGPPGDASDIAVLVFSGTIMLLRVIGENIG